MTLNLCAAGHAACPSEKWAGQEEEVGQEQAIDLAELTSKQVSHSADGEKAQECHEKSALNCLTLLHGHPKENGNENGYSGHNSCDKRPGKIV